MFKSIKDEAMWILIALALAGCAKTTPTESGFKAVGDSIDALEASLPKECATDGITKQIAALRAHLASQMGICEQEKDLAVTKEKKKTLFWRSVSIITALLALLALRLKRVLS